MLFVRNACHIPYIPHSYSKILNKRRGGNTRMYHDVISQVANKIEVFIYED